MSVNKKIDEPQTAEEQQVVTFANFKPDTENNTVSVISSTYKEAEEWGAMPVSDDELNENLGLDLEAQDNE